MAKNKHCIRGKNDWYIIVRSGSGPYPMPPRGPFDGIDAAEDAIERWRSKVGSLAGTIMAAHSIRIYGPYCTRHEAMSGDISEFVG